MLVRRLTLALLLLGTTLGLSAQDIHYTLHNNSPLWLNPANTGAFLGSIRVAGHFRSQYIGIENISTPGLSLDAPIIRGLRKQDWIGVGANLIMDKANEYSVDVVRQVFGFSAAYHLALDKKRRNVLTLGAQYGSVSIGINPTGNCGVEELNIPTNEGGQGMAGQCEMFRSGASGDDGPRESYTDISAGLKYKTILDVKKDNTLEVGLAFQHINNASYQSFVGSGAGGGGTGELDARRPGMNIHAHANADMEVSEKIRFMPTVFYQANKGNSSISLQAWGGLKFKEDMMFKAGLGYRTSDAAKLLLGFQKDRLNIAASYDLVISQATPNNLKSVNAVEIAANYIFNIYKKPKVNPSILCPRI